MLKMKKPGYYQPAINTTNPSTQTPEQSSIFTHLLEKSSSGFQPFATTNSRIFPVTPFIYLFIVHPFKNAHDSDFSTRIKQRTSAKTELKHAPLIMPIKTPKPQQFAKTQTHMNFGNYTKKQYGLVGSRSDTGLSLYEKLFLRNHINRAAIKAAILTSKDQLGQSSNLLGKYNIVRMLTPKTSHPNISYQLFKKSHNNLTPMNMSRPVLLDQGSIQLNNSEKERYKKIELELCTLREKIMQDPNKTQILIFAVFLIKL